jgi:hypothetical protein
MCSNFRPNLARRTESVGLRFVCNSPPSAATVAVISIGLVTRDVFLYCALTDTKVIRCVIFHVE